jgi:mono/diheme cytochrome c family protein
MFKRIIIFGGLAAIALFVVLQLLPIGRAEANPAVVHEPAWDAPTTRELAARACFDCHSSETVWPWYSKIAPASWLLSRDATEARDVFSFSSWKSGDVSPERAARVVREGEMPPSRYLMLHPEARLTDAEIEALAQGLLQSLK